ncbi:MAG: TolC family protein, partial [Melioribacteraceae bacterium]|nr:TolC family protein [Melioribacteraceae bacterium]
DLTASQYLPQWSLGATALWGVPSPDLTNDPAFNYSVFSTFSVPLFLWNKSSLDVQAQTLLTDSQREQLEMLNEIVTLEVQSTKYSYDESIKRVELTSRSLKRAEENLDIMTTRYKEGLSPILEVLDAQVFWNKANVDYIEAKRLYQVSYSALLKSIGELY